MKFKRWLFIGLALFFIFSFSLPLSKGRAISVQEGDGARLYFDPTPLNLDLEEMTSAELLLNLENVQDAFAFDIKFEYDASLIKISSIELGDFFGDEIVCMDQVNDPGLFHYSCTRWGVSTGVSGSGNVLKMTVESLEESGETELSFTLAEVYDWPNVFVIEMVAEDGNVLVVGPPAPAEDLYLYLPLVLNGKAEKGEALP